MTNGKSEILYVDDEATNLLSFASGFRTGYTVHTANSGNEGIQALQEHPDIKVIITDQRMPEMTGIEFLEAIMADHPEPVRIILTGFADIDAIINSINIGKVFRYLTKPWDENDLKQTIDIAINFYDIEARKNKILEEGRATAQKQLDLIKLFQKYVPESIVSEIIERSDKKESLLGGEARVVSILIGDIPDFHEKISSLAPKQALEYLSKYFTIVNNCVSKYNGTILNSVGARYQAIFAAPSNKDNERDNVIQCALETVEKINEFSKDQLSVVGNETNIILGINTGNTIIGHIGSETRVSYSAVGSPVKTASEIIELTKTKKNSIIVSESTYDIVKAQYKFEEVGSQHTGKGEQPIKLFTLVAK